MNLDRIIAVRNNKTVYRDGDLCMKVFNEAYSKADVLNEALNQARIEETGLRIPRIREVTVVNGRWTIVSDYIRGRTMAALMEENPDRRNEYLNLLTDLQLEMHGKTCPMLNKLRDKMHRKIDEAALPGTVRYSLHTRLESLPRHNKICHGDFCPENIIVDEAGTPYILDWSHAAQGNASADAAWTYLLFWLNGDISGAGEYLRLFCEKSGTELAYVQQWLPLVAAAQLAGSNEKEREFLQSWINGTDLK